MSPVEQFADAMARLASGVAVVTAKRPDGAPTGLVVTSLCSYSLDPPSVLVAVDRSARSHPALAASSQFGVQLLRREQEAVAAVFASRTPEKFSTVAWSWNGEVPELAGTLAFLRCETTAVFEHGDHSILIGKVLEAHPREGEPLVYFERRVAWRLNPDADGEAEGTAARQPLLPTSFPLGILSRRRSTRR